MRHDDLESELKARAPEILSNQEIRWEQGGRVLKISWKGHDLRLAVHLVPQASLAQLKEVIFSIEKEHRRSSDPVPLVVASYLGEDARELCRAHGLFYLDLSGNVWIAHGSMLIEKEVWASRYALEARNRSPFADRASLILRFLLDKGPEPAGVREIAVAVGISPGYVSKMLRVAEGSHYVIREADRRYRIKNQRELLGDWSSYYNWRKNEIESYFLMPARSGSVGDLLKDVLPKAGAYALSLHAGNNLIEPFAQSDVWHLYVADPGVAKAIKDRLPLKPVEKNAGNVVLMRPYYRESVLQGFREVKGFRVVSDLQLYLDLKHYPVRGEEAASQILGRRLSKAWSLEPAHARV